MASWEGLIDFACGRTKADVITGGAVHPVGFETYVALPSRNVETVKLEDPAAAERAAEAQRITRSKRS